MKRIIVIGCCGSGKSTLSRKLSPLLGLPVVHLDQLFWREGWVSVGREEFRTLLDKELEKERWIIDGNFSNTLDVRLERCDTVIYIDLPAVVCLFRVLKRVFGSYGTVRPDMSEGCPERLDIPFLFYTLSFNRKNRKKLYEAIGRRKDKEIIILKSQKQIDAFLKDMETKHAAQNKISY